MVDVLLYLGTRTIPMPRPQQILGNSLTTTTSSRRLTLDWISLRHSRRLSLHKLNSCPVNLSTYNFLAWTASKYCSQLFHLIHAENTVPLFFQSCKHDCCSDWLATTTVYRVVAQQRLIACLLIGHCLALGVYVTILTTWRRS
jgi:hypothetical protein